ncbi:hypothetical protein ACE6H2_019792 [Prunus campanulata]
MLCLVLFKFFDVLFLCLGINFRNLLSIIWEITRGMLIIISVPKLDRAHPILLISAVLFFLIVIGSSSSIVFFTILLEHLVPHIAFCSFL